MPTSRWVRIAQQTAAADVAKKARRLELELIEPLCAADPNGVIGRSLAIA